MSTWTSQMGYPVLDVDVVETNDDSITVSISQEKYGPGGAGWYTSDTLSKRVSLNKFV